MFNSLRQEPVTLIKKNGDRIEDIRAHVQNKLIFVEDATLNIEEGDIIARTLPSGTQQPFLVIDRGFFRGRAGHKDHYQVKVGPLSQGEFEARSHSTTIITVQGTHAKVYNNSVDKSTNFFSIEQYEIFEEMKEIISKQSLNEAEKSAILAQVDAMSKAEDNKSYLSRYKELINSLASHATILVSLAQYLPSITGLL